MAVGSPNLGEHESALVSTEVTKRKAPFVIASIKSERKILIVRLSSEGASLIGGV